MVTDERERERERERESERGDELCERFFHEKKRDELKEKTKRKQK